MDKENNIIIYQDENEVTRVSVRFADEDLWLTQAQLAEIYCTTQQNVALHIKNIYEDDELQEVRTYKDFLLVGFQPTFSRHLVENKFSTYGLTKTFVKRVVARCAETSPTTTSASSVPSSSGSRKSQGNGVARTSPQYSLLKQPAMQHGRKRTRDINVF